MPLRPYFDPPSKKTGDRKLKFNTGKLKTVTKQEPTATSGLSKPSIREKMVADSQGRKLKV